MLPTIVQAYAEGDHTIVVQFADGRIVRWDMQPLLAQGGVFARLRDPDAFQREITVLNGTVAWSADFDPTRCIDLDPIVLYERGEDITDQAVREDPGLRRP